MTDHEQPAAGVAEYRNFPGHSMCCRCISCENANRNRDLWFPGDPPRAPTDAGGAVSEAATRLRDRVSRWTDQDYLGDDRLEVDDALELADDISAVLAALTPAPQPLQQGGEVTRAELVEAMRENVTIGTITECSIELEFDTAADAILALFASRQKDQPHD